jgi:chromosome segregation ATPase
MTSIITTAEEYELKCDSKSNKIRDLTWEELKCTYGKNSTIICPCSSREYTVNASFISAHQQSQKHSNWVLKEHNTYIEEYGHCADHESRMDTLYKELREQKVLYHNLVLTKEQCDARLEKLENKYQKQKRIIIVLREREENYQDIIDEKNEKIDKLNDDLNSKSVEVKTLLKEIRMLEKQKIYVRLNSSNRIKLQQQKTGTNKTPFR